MSTLSMTNESSTLEPSTMPGQVELTGPIQFTILAVVYILIALLGISGNSLVIAAVVLCRKLQTPTNVFVVSLAVTDLLSCLTMPFQAAMFLSDENSRLPSGLCAFVGAISIVCLVGSIVTLALIAFNRCFLITQTRKTYSWLYTTNMLFIMIAMAWLYPTLVIVVPLAAGIGQLGYSPSYKACLWDESHPLAYISDILVAITFFFTFIIILVCYIKIWLYIRNHVRRIRRTQSSTKSSTPTAGGQSHLEDLSSTQEHHTDPGNNANSPPHVTNGNVTEKKSRPKTVSNREIEITKNLFYVVCAFFLCIIPYTITLTLPVNPTLDLLVLYASVPLMFNGCVNPMIYAYKHPTMKVVFRYIVTCKVGSIPKPSKCLRRVLSSSRQIPKLGVRANGMSDLRYSQNPSRATPPQDTNKLQNNDSCA